jgi:signal transduction histidine kinase
MTGEPGRILVVDDNRINRMKLSMNLEQQGHSVKVAEDGQHAMEMLKAEPFDVVLLDIIMPGMDGFQVLEKMKSDQALRDIPVIVISALEELDSVVRCIEMGAEDYLPKSFDPVLLQARLNSSLQKKKLRDLEKVYLQQEVMLRESEKLATLGRLSAGMAHELNNPAAAAQRGAAQLQTAFSRMLQVNLQLGKMNLTDAQIDNLILLEKQVEKKAQKPFYTNALDRSDAESELETWLGEKGVDEAWNFAHVLLTPGFDKPVLEKLAASFNRDQFIAAVNWLTSSVVIYTLLEEIRQGSGRISEIVKALKSYTYMDQAPVQNVDVHDGLDNTLVILHSKLAAGVTVHREYAAHLPRIEAYGSELNQVWTNLIDNAIDAMDGKGEITLRTRSDADWVIVEVEDNGPGIPPGIQSRIYDPFFTTKAPGKGTGLGLNISHNIIVQKHKGKMEVHSQPGMTRFEVSLPLHLAQGE